MMLTLNPSVRIKLPAAYTFIQNFKRLANSDPTT